VPTYNKDEMVHKKQVQRKAKTHGGNKRYKQLIFRLLGGKKSLESGLELMHTAHVSIHFDEQVSF